MPVMLLRVLSFGITALFFFGGGTNFSGPSGTCGAVLDSVVFFSHSCYGVTKSRATDSDNETAARSQTYRPHLLSGS